MSNKQMIEAKKIIPQVVEHFNPNDESMGFLNEIENVELRCQISEEKTIGYYVMFEGEKILIEANGKINEWPTGLYDTHMNLMARLFKAQR